MPWTWESTSAVAKQKSSLVIAFFLFVIGILVFSMSVPDAIRYNSALPAIVGSAALGVTGFFFLGMLFTLRKMARVRSITITDDGYLVMDYVDGQFTYGLDEVNMCYKRVVMYYPVSPAGGAGISRVYYYVTIKYPGGKYTMPVSQGQLDSLVHALVSNGRDLRPCSRAYA